MLRTEFLQIRQPFIHTSSELRPFRKLILRAGLQQLLLVHQYLRLELSLLHDLGRVKQAQIEGVYLYKRESKVSEP